MKFNYQLSFNFVGKNNHNFPNNEIKRDFFSFLPVFFSFSILFFGFCAKKQLCIRTIHFFIVYLCPKV